jgi:uncharacterized protein
MQGAITAIVKPTLDCNMKCSYCYEGNNPYKNMTMDDGTLKSIIKKIGSYNGEQKETTFIWHGGEPLLMGMGFFNKIVTIQDELKNYRFRNCLQTNGTLVNRPLIQFFRSQHFSVGMSLDGPEQLNNLQRRYGNGNKTFNRVLDVIKMFDDEKLCKKDRSVLNGVVAVLTKNTLDMLDEFYKFFVSRGISVRINPIFYEGNGKTVRDHLGVTAEDFADVMIYIFDKWFFNSNEVVRIEPLFEMLGNLMYGSPRSCVFTMNCYAEFLEVTPNGDVYPCTGAATKSFCLGNINQQEMSDMLRSPVLKYFRAKRRSALRNCQSCDYFSICNAGCVRKSYMRRRRLNDRDFFCIAYKRLYKHMDSVLKNELGENYRGTYLSVSEKIQNHILREIISCRAKGSRKKEHLWSDTTWSQWRGDYSEWSGQYHDTTGCY